MSADRTRRIYFNQALEVFGKDEYHQPEVARTKHKMAQFLKTIGDIDGAREKEIEARTIYKSLAATCDDCDELTDAAYDHIVFFWSR